MKWECKNCKIIKDLPKWLAEARTYCSRNCMGKCKDFTNKISNSRKGKCLRGKNPAWKGGIRYAMGYKFLLVPNHPNCDKKGYVQEHRLIMEKKLNRLLKRWEVIHHINGNKLDNRIENLYLTNQSDHMKGHIKNKDIDIYYWKDKKHSKETKEKMSRSHRKRLNGY